MTRAPIDIVRACSDPNLFGPWFRDPSTWRSWFCFLRALFALSMSEEDWALFRQCTGRDDRPAVAFREAWLIVGRRGGKSIVLALIAVFLATFIDWSPCLSPGERGTVMVIATDRRQARTIFRYARALLGGVPMLAALVERETADEIDLDNGVTIEITASSYRTVRGYTLIAALLDELAFWPSDESALPDTETLAALRPAMASVPGSMLLCASSPYARRGALWQGYKRHFGKASPVLVWKAGTRTMNPTIPREVIDEAMEDDPATAKAEYGAEFRVDIETFVAREVIEAATFPGRVELPPVADVRYFAFTDPSGGSNDSMTLGLAHAEGEVAVLDLVREVRPPFSPDAVVDEFVPLLGQYRCNEVTGDRFGGEFCQERFKSRGVEYRVSERTKNEIYLELLPLLNSRRVELLDIPRLAAQLGGLERRTARGGKDSVDHAPGSHDDVINSAAGSLVTASGTGSSAFDIETWCRAWVPGYAN